ncbi:ProQ/FinO family protein [Acidovorax sp. LjRoot129]|uniref:ProQ/FINO family protein n=1 Tax=unclassified Acidovorax TaxID=2684926 RepID=UPI003ECDAA35
MTVIEKPEASTKATVAVEETAVAREVATLWPHLFGPGVFVPLKVGIDKALAIDAERRGSLLTRAKIRLFLGWHVRRVGYLEAAKEGVPRHGVKGIPEIARVITEANVAYALEKLQAVLKRDDAPSVSDVDGEEGMAWWNGLDRRERAKWMKAAGETAVAADAWNAFKVALMSLV